MEQPYKLRLSPFRDPTIVSHRKTPSYVEESLLGDNAYLGYLLICRGVIDTQAGKGRLDIRMAPKNLLPSIGFWRKRISTKTRIPLAITGVMLRLWAWMQVLSNKILTLLWFT